MFPFINFTQKKDTIPTLTSRLFAAIIDCTIVIIILYPIQNFILGLVYEVPPTTELSKILNSSAQETKLFSQFITNLQHNQKLRQFIAQGKFKIVITIQVLQLIVLASYVLFFWTKYQATPGKMLISAKIVDAKTNKKPTIMQCVTRLFSYTISIIPLFIGFLIVPFNKQRKAFHDLIANTKVVSTKNDTK